MSPAQHLGTEFKEKHEFERQHRAKDEVSPIEVEQEKHEDWSIVTRKGY